VFTDFPATAISARDHQLGASHNRFGGLVFSIGVVALLTVGLAAVMIISLLRRYRAQRADLPTTDIAPRSHHRRVVDLNDAHAVELHSLVSHADAHEDEGVMDVYADEQSEDGLELAADEL
jgi:hypothetical protein